MVTLIEDLSVNGTFINEAMIGPNYQRELKDYDEIAIADTKLFVFRRPVTRPAGNAFLQHYTILERIGRGHFAEVFLCVEKSTGQRYAVKVFAKVPVFPRSQNEGLQQEVAILLGVSHPNIIGLKDTFDEENAVYMVLELAPENELFNLVITKQKLTEPETRKIFLQLFQCVKYLVSGIMPHCFGVQ